MAIYTIRPTFTIFQNGNIFLGGSSIDLTAAEFERHKHKLQGVDSAPLPEQPGGNSSSDLNCYPPPYLASVFPKRILAGMKAKLELGGSFFKPDLEITGTGLTVDVINFISDNLVEIEVTAGEDLGFFDLILNNSSEAQFESVVEIIQPIILDLRSGTSLVVEKDSDTVLSYSNSWLEVRSNATSWRSFIRFVGQNNKYVWNRSQKKNLSWLFFPSTNMIGIGSRSTNPSSSSQYTQAEILGYLSNSNNFWGLYGNNGNIGSTATQYLNQPIPTDGNPFKLTLTNNGEPGGTYSLYEFANRDSGWETSGLNRQEFIAQNLATEDWFSTDGLVTTGEISSDMGADEPEIMPFLTLSTNQTLKIIGFYIS